MRLSIWHEWSSNHSGDFRIVGVFPTTDGARRAAQAMWRLWGWYMDQEAREQAEHMAALSSAQQDDQRWLLELYMREAAAAHAALGEQPAAQPPSSEGVEVPPPSADWSTATGLDWSRYVELAMPVLPWLQPLQIHIWDRTVILYNHNTWDTAPAEGYDLLRALGADVAALNMFEGTVITRLIVRVGCLAPDPRTAGRIAGPLRRYFATTGQRRPRHASPWGAEPKLHANGSVLRSGRRISIVASFAWPEQGVPALVAYLATSGCTAIRYSMCERRRAIHLPHRAGRRHIRPAPRYRPLREVRRRYAGQQWTRLLQARREEGFGI